MYPLIMMIIVSGLYVPLGELLVFLGIFWRRFSLLSILAPSSGLMCYISGYDVLLCDPYEDYWGFYVKNQM